MKHLVALAILAAVLAAPAAAAAQDTSQVRGKVHRHWLRKFKTEGAAVLPLVDFHIGKCGPRGCRVRWHRRRDEAAATMTGTDFCKLLLGRVSCLTRHAEFSIIIIDPNP